jgi:acetate kinase
MRDLLASPDIAARQAVDLFVHHCVSAIGALTAVLGGIDALVFSGGIGSRSSEIRANICTPLEFLGLVVDAQANMDSAERISPAKSRVAVFTLTTDEELVIARHCRAMLSAEKQWEMIAIVDSGQSPSGTTD